MKNLIRYLKDLHQIWNYIYTNKEKKMYFSVFVCNEYLRSKTTGPIFHP